MNRYYFILQATLCMLLASPGSNALLFIPLGTTAANARLLHKENVVINSYLQASSSATVGETIKRTSPSEVVSLFDGFAPSFETKLVDVLKYSTPSDVAKVATDRIINHRDKQLYNSILDAGCGTGLSGPYLRDLVISGGPLVGVDLSPKMAELAAELMLLDDKKSPESQPTVKEPMMKRSLETARLALGGAPRLYNGIYIGDLLDLDNSKLLDGYGHQISTTLPETFDLVVAADVLCYFGEMGQVLKALSQRVMVGGDLIFSTETFEEGDYNWVRQSSGRYAHCPQYVEKMASEAGLTLVSQEAFSPRFEANEKVLGTIHTFHKAA